MNKELKINFFYNDEAGSKLLDILTRDFKEFLNNYIKKVLK